MKNSITKDTTRQKNRIKSQLRYLGIGIPQEFLEPFSNWSKRFFAWLKEVETLTPSGRQALDIQIRHSEELRRRKLEMTRTLRTLAKTDRLREPLRLVMTVPGFGQAAGMAFLSEICDITRFRNAEQLAAYIGMIPMCHASGEKDATGDIIVRKHAVMRCTPDRDGMGGRSSRPCDEPVFYRTVQADAQEQGYRKGRPQTGKQNILCFETPDRICQQRRVIEKLFRQTDFPGENTTSLLRR